MDKKLCSAFSLWLTGTEDFSKDLDVLVEAGILTEANKDSVEEMSDGYQGHVRLALTEQADKDDEQGGMCWATEPATAGAFCLVYGVDDAVDGRLVESGLRYLHSAEWAALGWLLGHRRLALGGGVEITKASHGARLTPTGLPLDNGISVDAVLTASWYQPEEVAEGDPYEGVPRVSAGERYSAWAIAPGPSRALLPCSRTWN